ncbi:MAG: DUF11 domain-containing protein [Candidatus Blackburnbacteria bacterium]|nr:DUF11 domain-containing protein [Candidatus Blackburnbacteria bacterium]
MENTLTYANKIGAAIILVSGLLIAATSSTFAAAPCPAQYGVAAPYGGECPAVGVIQINKEVLDPTEKIKEKEWKDNIPASIHKFSPGDEITFRLRIKNIGDKTLDKIQVTDTLPNLLEPVSGEFSFEIKDLKVDQVVEKELKARVVTSDKLPQDKLETCDFNVAKAVTGDKNDEDKAQVCVERKPIKALPKAGSQNTVLAILMLSVIGFVGTKLFSLKSLKKIA